MLHSEINVRAENLNFKLGVLQLCETSSGGAWSKIMFAFALTAPLTITSFFVRLVHYEIVASGISTGVRASSIRNYKQTGLDAPISPHSIIDSMKETSNLSNVSPDNWDASNQVQIPLATDIASLTCLGSPTLRTTNNAA